MTITEEELEAWEQAEYGDPDREMILRLIAEVRRQREVNSTIQKSNKILREDREYAREKIEEQAKEIAKLKGETRFGHGRAVAGLERFR